MAECSEPLADGKSPPRSPRIRAFRFKESVDPKHTYQSSSSSSNKRHGHRRHHHRHRSSSSGRSHRRRDRRRSEDELGEDAHDGRSSRRKRKGRSRSPGYGRRYRHSPSPSPGPPSRGLSPNTAFRESLFDAMADDEGAAYWEGVYGQPIHAFGPMPAAASSSGPTQHSGDTYEGDDYNDPSILDADAYAAYVRRKMWERSHQAIMEERERREKEREKAEEAMKKEREEKRRINEEFAGKWYKDRQWRKNERSAEKDDFQSMLDESLRRGETRREEKRWREAWERYNAQWATLLAEQSVSTAKNAPDKRGGTADRASSVLPWPVRSGKQADAEQLGAIREFFERAPLEAAKKKKPGMAESVDVKALLKAERVRWHPDKIMQRFNDGVDEATLRSVTAVFQSIDQIWNELKS